VPTFKQKARKPDFELTKPSTGQDYNIELLGLPAYKTAKRTTEKKGSKLHYTST
jgi:hypothetical protein